MVSRIYEQIIKENFDIDHNYTRHTLLTIDEADQTKVMESLTSKLYKSIMDKVDDIDFGGIPETKGDITLLENYDSMIECIGVIKSILIEYRQDTDPVDVIQLAIKNVQERKEVFGKAFAFKADLPILLYNTIVLSIVSSVSLIIATSIEFIKSTGTESYQIQFDKVSYVKSKNNILYENLVKFNNECRSGKIDECIDHVIKSGSKQLLGLTPFSVVTIAAVIAILTNIIPILRELVFFFYHCKQSLADYFVIQADLLQMNAEYVKNNDVLPMSTKERNEISKKQNNIVKKFRSIGNKLDVKIKTSEKKAKSDIANNKKKYKLDEIIPEKLDSAEPDPGASSIF